MPNNENTDLQISEVSSDTLLVTAQKMELESLERAMYDYTNKNNLRSTYFNEESNGATISIDTIDGLASNAQSDIDKIKQINNIVRFFINKNEILGKIFEAIEININPDIRLNFPYIDEEDENITKRVENLIKDFNNKIELDTLITESIPMTYSEGNYITYLRKSKDSSNFQVDYFPLGIAEISDYNEGRKPYVLINVKELKTRLRKIYKKNKKGKALFYKNMDEEIKATYPEEVYNAYINNEQYAILDIGNTGVMRINNMKRKYGVSPIFKALKPVIRLENIELSDDKNTLVRGKKIIFQKLCKELITQTSDLPNITWSQAQAKAHMDLMAALGAKGTSVYTGLPWTESILYVEPKLEQTNVQVKTQYKNDIMTSIGIAYLSSDSKSVATAQISVGELMKVINKISEQLEKILYGWYQKLLIDNGIDIKYTPSIKFLDSEQLSNNIKLSLVELLYSKLNCSITTAYEVLGLNAKDEYRRLKEEDKKGYRDIFMPHQTSYTSNNDTFNNKGGNPRESNDPNKKDYDDSRKPNTAIVGDD